MTFRVWLVIYCKVSLNSELILRHKWMRDPLYFGFSKWRYSWMPSKLNMNTLFTCMCGICVHCVTEISSTLWSSLNKITVKLFFLCACFRIHTYNLNLVFSSFYVFDFSLCVFVLYFSPHFTNTECNWFSGRRAECNNFTACGNFASEFEEFNCKSCYLTWN